MTLMKVIFVFGMAGSLLSLPGCSSDDSPTTASNQEITADQAKEKATAIVPGTAFYAQDINEGDEKLFDVRVRIASGREVKVVLFREGGALDEIEAEEGPFDYDLPAPIAGMMTLAQARAKAIETKAGNVEVWEFHAEKKEYEFYVRDPSTQLWEIKMAGDSGSVTTVEKKDKPD